jgi:hypothetical protein
MKMAQELVQELPLEFAFPDRELAFGEPASA